jgi:hypothetical protein
MIRSAGNPSVHIAGRMRGPVVRPRRADGPLSFLRVFGRRLGAAGATMNPLAANAVAQAIQTQEGYYPGSLAYQNNNPGNLVYAGQPGATQGAGGFAAFSSYNAGYSALLNQINLDATRGTDVNGNPTTTVGQLIASWAPSSDPANNTPAYVASVVSQTGYSASDNLLSLGVDSSLPTVTSVVTYDSPEPLTGEVLTDDSGDSGDDAGLDYSDAGSAVPSMVWWLAGGVLAVLLFRR